MANFEKTIPPKEFKFIPQPHKDLLKSGDRVIYRVGEERFALLEVEKFIGKCDFELASFYNYTDDLKTTETFDDIMEIWRGDELIAKRIEKPEKEIEIDRIESEMRKLADDLRKVKGE